jgi:hypothetical protein
MFWAILNSLLSFIVYVWVWNCICTAFLGPAGAMYGFLFTMIAYPEAIVASKSVLLPH